MVRFKTEFERLTTYDRVIKIIQIQYKESLLICT